MVCVSGVNYDSGGKSSLVLYSAIENKRWAEIDRIFADSDCDTILKAEATVQAKTWVYRTCPGTDGKIKWRLTVLHAAVIFHAPIDILQRLLVVNPAAVKQLDDQGNLPLHLAYKNGLDKPRINVLLNAYSNGMTVKNRKGLTPMECAKFFRGKGQQRTQQTNGNRGKGPTERETDYTSSPGLSLTTFFEDLFMCDDASYFSGSETFSYSQASCFFTEASSCFSTEASSCFSTEASSCFSTETPYHRYSKSETLAATAPAQATINEVQEDRNDISEAFEVPQGIMSEQASDSEMQSRSGESHGSDIQSQNQMSAALSDEQSLGTTPEGSSASEIQESWNGISETNQMSAALSAESLGTTPEGSSASEMQESWNHMSAASPEYSQSTAGREKPSSGYLRQEPKGTALIYDAPLVDAMVPTEEDEDEYYGPPIDTVVSAEHDEVGCGGCSIISDLSLATYQPAQAVRKKVVLWLCVN